MWTGELCSSNHPPELRSRTPSFRGLCLPIFVGVHPWARFLTIFHFLRGKYASPSETLRKSAFWGAYPSKSLSGLFPGPYHFGELKPPTPPERYLISSLFGYLTPKPPLRGYPGYHSIRIFFLWGGIRPPNPSPWLCTGHRSFLVSSVSVRPGLLPFRRFFFPKCRWGNTLHSNPNTTPGLYPDPVHLVDSSLQSPPELRS